MPLRAGSNSARSTPMTSAILPSVRESRRELRDVTGVRLLSAPAVLRPSGEAESDAASLLTGAEDKADGSAPKAGTWGVAVETEEEAVATAALAATVEAAEAAAACCASPAACAPEFRRRDEGAETGSDDMAAGTAAESAAHSLSGCALSCCCSCR